MDAAGLDAGAAAAGAEEDDDEDMEASWPEPTDSQEEDEEEEEDRAGERKGSEGREGREGRDSNPPAASSRATSCRVSPTIEPERPASAGVAVAVFTNASTRPLLMVLVVLVLA